jgi:hypothetical protein
MHAHGFHQHHQLQQIRSRTARAPAAMPSTCISSSGRCSAHSLCARQHSHIRAASTLATVAAANSNSLVSCPWLLRRGAGRQLLPPPAATEDASKADGPLQDNSRGGSSRGRGVSRGRGSSSKRSWEHSDSRDRGNVSGVGSQESSWQAQAQHGRGGGSSSSSRGRGRDGFSTYRGRGSNRGRLYAAGSSGDWSGSDSNNAGTSSGSSSSRGRGGSRGRGRSRNGSNFNNASSSWRQQGGFDDTVSMGMELTNDVCRPSVCCAVCFCASVGPCVACPLSAWYVSLHQ